MSFTSLVLCLISFWCIPRASSTLDIRVDSYFPPQPGCQGTWEEHSDIDLDPTSIVECATLCQAKSTCHGIKLASPSKSCQTLSNMSTISCPPLARGQYLIDKDILIDPKAFEPLAVASFVSVNVADGPMLWLPNEEPGPRLPVWTSLSIWVPYKDGLLGCGESLTDGCRFWRGGKCIRKMLEAAFSISKVEPVPHAGMPDWESFQAPKRVHAKGVMGTLNGIPYLIGGYEPNANHNQVEFYNEDTNQWEIGPPVSQPKRAMSLVQVSPDQVIIIGGYHVGLAIQTVETVTTGDTQWSALADYPLPMYHIAATIMELANGTRGVVAIGGYKAGQITESQAYFFNLDTQHWNRIPEFDYPLGCAYGWSRFQSGTLYLFPGYTGVTKPTSDLLRKQFVDSDWTGIDLGLPPGGKLTALFHNTTAYLRKT